MYTEGGLIPEFIFFFFIRDYFRWTRDIFKIGQKRAIGEHEIYEVLDDLRSETITNKLSKAWAEEKQKKAPSLVRIIYKMYGAKLLLWNILFLSFVISIE